MNYELSPSILKELLTMVMPDFTEHDWVTQFQGIG